MIVKARRVRDSGGMDDIPAPKDDRAARLAAQLRANLRKRKAQARGDQPPPTKPPSA
jgi:hypothetical protein